VPVDGAGAPLSTSGAKIIICNMSISPTQLISTVS